MRIRNVGATLIMITLMAGSAFAHHSFTAEFDEKKPVKLEGKVTKMEWSNPHSWIYIDVETNGKVVNWALETGAANSLIRRGCGRSGRSLRRAPSLKWMAGRRATARPPRVRVQYYVYRWETAVRGLVQ